MDGVNVNVITLSFFSLIIGSEIGNSTNIEGYCFFNIHRKRAIQCSSIQEHDQLIVKPASDAPVLYQKLQRPYLIG